MGSTLPLFFPLLSLLSHGITLFSLCECVSLPTSTFCESDSLHTHFLRERLFFSFLFGDVLVLSFTPSLTPPALRPRATSFFLPHSRRERRYARGGELSNALPPPRICFFLGVFGTTNTSGGAVMDLEPVSFHCTLRQIRNKPADTRKSLRKDSHFFFLLHSRRARWSD